MEKDNFLLIGNIQDRWGLATYYTTHKNIKEHGVEPALTYHAHAKFYREKDIERIEELNSFNEHTIENIPEKICKQVMDPFKGQRSFERYVPIQDVAKAFDITTRSLYRMIDSRAIPYTTIGNLIKFNKFKILFYLYKNNIKDELIKKFEDIDLLRPSKISEFMLTKHQTKLKGSPYHFICNNNFNVFYINRSIRIRKKELNRKLEKGDVC